MIPERTTAVKRLRKLNQRTKIVRGGSSAGKTIAILCILIDYALRHENKEISIVSESIPHLRRGALRDFLKIMKGLNRYREKEFNRSTLKYEFWTGSYIEFFSTDQPELINMQNMTVYFYFKDSTLLKIEGKTGVYNNKTFDMKFTLYDGENLLFRLDSFRELTP